MTSPLNEFKAIQFVATPATPGDQLPLNGLYFYFPPEYLSAVGSGPGNPGAINAGSMKVKGYLDASDPNALKWVMIGLGMAQSEIDAQVDAIPGGLGWVRPESRATFMNIGGVLVNDYEVPLPDVLGAWDQMYDAARLNRDQQIAMGG